MTINQMRYDEEIILKDNNQKVITQIKVNFYYGSKSIVIMKNNSLVEEIFIKSYKKVSSSTYEYITEPGNNTYLIDKAGNKFKWSKSGKKIELFSNNKLVKKFTNQIVTIRDEINTKKQSKTIIVTKKQILENKINPPQESLTKFANLFEKYENFKNTNSEKPKIKPSGFKKVNGKMYEEIKVESNATNFGDKKIKKKINFQSSISKVRNNHASEQRIKKLKINSEAIELIQKENEFKKNINLETPIFFNDKTIIIVQIGDRYGIKNQNGVYIHELEYDFIGREIHNSKDGFYILGRKNGDVFQDKLYLK